MFYVLCSSFFYGPIVSDTNKCMYVCMLYCCETQLLVTIQDLLFHRDKHIPVDMAILDFSKAFDAAPHRHLLGKLSLYGINGPILHWIEAFLTDRVQGVVQGLL